MATKDGYSNFGFFQTLPPQDFDGTASNGVAIDMQGFETVTIVVNVGGFTSAGAMSTDNQHEFILEHADISVSGGAGTFAAALSTDMIRNASGAVTSGVWQSLGSYTDGSQVYQIGYKGKKRFVRLTLSGNGAPSVMSAGAIVIGGLPADWPVNTVG